MVRAAKIMVVLGLLVLCGSAWAVEPNLVSHWKFDETSGITALDCVGDNNGTVHGAVWTAGQIDGALSFDGADNYVEVNNPDNLNFGNSIDFTFAAWIKAETSQRKHPAIIGRRNPGNAHGYIFFLYSYGKLAVQLNDGIHSNYISTGPDLSDDTWHHVAATGDREGDLIFYIDGVQAGQNDISGKGNIDSTANLYIGWEERNPTLTYFNGIIDEVAIYNRALSAEEIQQLYYEGLSDYERAVIRVENAIDKKQEALETIDAALDEEEDAYDALEELLESKDYGDLKKGDIITAKQKIHSAMQHQEQSIDALEKSIEKLEDSLSVLGYEVGPNGSNN